MRKSITVNIPEPCHEDWNKMTPKEQGRHCVACNKTVVDFTKQTDEQIIKTLESKGNLCGRFKNQQLNREIVLARKDKNTYLSWAASGLFAFLAFGNQDLQAQGSPKIVQTDSLKIRQVKGKVATSILQEKVIYGTITTSDDGLPLPGASVLIKGTSRGQQTDFDGKYTIKANQGDILLISYVGMKSIELTIGVTNIYDTSLTLNNSLEEVIVVGGMVSYCEPSDYERYPSGDVYFSRTQDQKNWLSRNKQRRAKWKAERMAKREDIKNGEQERTNFGKLFFGIKSLFSKK